MAEDRDRTWRRVVALLILAVAFVVGGAALWLYAAKRLDVTASLGLGALLLALLAALAVLLRTGPPPLPRALPRPDPREGLPVLEERLLQARCARCGTVSEVVDTGERPLEHACVGCGARGVLIPGPRAPGGDGARFGDSP